MRPALRNMTFTAFFLPAATTAGIGLASDFQIIGPNETAMNIQDGVVTVRLSNDGCAAGFESACTSTRQRAEYQLTRDHKHGDRIAYRWQVNVPKDLTINASDVHLYAGRFLSGDKPTLQFFVGHDYGYEISRKTCFGPEGFGEWHQVEVHIMWDSTKKKGLKDKTPGEIHVSCDGKEVYSKTGRPNIKPDDTINLALGLEGALKLADGDNVSVSYRNIEVGSW